MSQTTLVKKLTEVLVQNEPVPDRDWQIRIFVHGECLSYIAWNEVEKEILLIDPKMECMEHYLSLRQELPQMLWLAVIETHTHADHISAAAQAAAQFNAPLIMHHLAPSHRIDLKIMRQTQLPTRSGAIRFIPTPGHTADSLCVIWGPYVFTGDTVLFGDVGRDDLPTGNPEEHYDSLQTLRNSLNSFSLICPGHDSKGGRISTWGTQLQMNSSLTQERLDYVNEATAFDAPAPHLFKKSLAENFK